MSMDFPTECETIRRQMRSLAELDESKDIPLSRLARYWFSLPRRRGVLPNVNDVGLMDLANLGVLGWFHILSVESDNPRDFGYEVLALKAQVGHRGLRLGDLQHPKL